MTIIEDIYANALKVLPDKCRDIDPWKQCRKCEKFKTCDWWRDLFWEVDKVKYLASGGEICPVCGINELRGKQSTCSDACRQKLSRENKIILSRLVTLLQVSTRRAEKFGEYLSKFKSNERPKDISVERMKELESGRFLVLTAAEIFALWETYPDTLSVLFGIY